MNCTACNKPIEESYLTRLNKPYHNECYVGKDLTNNFMDTISIVKQMRSYQKEYFKKRSKPVLLESIKLEREVDSSLEFYKPCPKCKKENYCDPCFDLMFCFACGYCTHGNTTGGVCDFCGKKESLF